jgi:quaternary ammonium compound-resistance protein SugE
MNHYWWMLLVAGLLETGWAIGLKYTDGFTRLWPSVATLLALALSMYLLAQAARGIPIGTAYSMWVGIGALGTIVLGIILFQESAGFWRVAFALLLLLSLVGLKFTSPE